MKETGQTITANCRKCGRRMTFPVDVGPGRLADDLAASLARVAECVICDACAAASSKRKALKATTPAVRLPYAD
jgi:hypothetical protein